MLFVVLGRGAYQRTDSIWYTYHCGIVPWSDRGQLDIWSFPGKKRGTHEPLEKITGEMQYANLEPGPGEPKMNTFGVG